MSFDEVWETIEDPVAEKVHTCALMVTHYKDVYTQSMRPVTDLPSNIRKGLLKTLNSLDPSFKTKLQVCIKGETVYTKDSMTAFPVESITDDFAFTIDIDDQGIKIRRRSNPLFSIKI